MIGSMKHFHASRENGLCADASASLRRAGGSYLDTFDRQECLSC